MDTTTAERHTASPNILGRVFGRVKALEVGPDHLVIEHAGGNTVYVDYPAIVDVPRIRTRWTGGELSIATDQQQFRIPFLKTRPLQQAFELLNARAIRHLGAAIARAAEVFHQRAVAEYLRDSSVAPLDELLGPLVSRYRQSRDAWQDALPADAIAAVKTLDAHFPLAESQDTLREKYEAKLLVARQAFYDSIESNPLTEQQRLAVIRNNDRNLVLAAAGTGKTSVMVAKALDLIDSKQAEASDILVLAYNKAAATELAERVRIRAARANLGAQDIARISTFHALGRHVLRESGITTHLSDFTEDPIKLDMWVTGWLTDYIREAPEALRSVIALRYPPFNPFDFSSREEYEAHVRDTEYRTLNGETVRGYQELCIANWLFMNNVEYKYEDPYVTKRRIEVGFDYRPDFHIVDTNIYLEHFGINRQGQTRAGIDAVEYNRKIDSKRQLHRACGTRLIETYHYDWQENNLEARLEALLRQVGVPTRPKSHHEMFTKLRDMGFIDENAQRYRKCLQAIRVEHMDEPAILLRLEQNHIPKASEYAGLLGALHDAYVGELHAQGRIDFDDMIIRATDTIEQGRYLPRWKHILVDEFQDISMARMNFLQALVRHGPAPILTVVGDDWQSIYRFSGGKLELTTRFTERVGSHAKTLLEKTFRYNNSIAETAGTFVMQNPEQYAKHVETHTRVSRPAVTIVDSLVDAKQALEARALGLIRAIRESDPDGTVAVLARYRYLLKDIRTAAKGTEIAPSLLYWTFHGAKGLEADYCIVVGFSQGKMGFPNENTEEAVVEALLPTLDTYPHSEERRLLYVALTRARKKSYLIADPSAPSQFITELLSPRYHVSVDSTAFDNLHRKTLKCPMCASGYFRKHTGQYGDFYRCTSGPACRAKPRVCEKCGAPSIDSENTSICNNNACRHSTVICDQCGRPMKIRDGKYGKFWGCTGFGIKDDKCKNTRPY